MYTVEVTYYGKEDDVDTMMCESRPSLNVRGGFVFLDCGKGQKFVSGIDELVRIKIKYPLPDSIPNLKYSIDIKYATETENVELLFSPCEVNITVDGEEDGAAVIIVKEGDNIIRIVNGNFLRSVRVNTYTEDSK